MQLLRVKDFAEIGEAAAAVYRRECVGFLMSVVCFWGIRRQAPVRRQHPPRQPELRGFMSTGAVMNLSILQKFGPAPTPPRPLKHEPDRPPQNTPHPKKNIRPPLSQHIFTVRHPPSLFPSLHPSPVLGAH